MARSHGHPMAIYHCAAINMYKDKSPNKKDHFAPRPKSKTPRVQDSNASIRGGAHVLHE